MGLAFILGLLYGNYLFRFKRIFTAIVDSLTVIPLTLFAYIVLSSVLVMDSFTSTFKYPLWERAGFEGLFLAVAVVPVVSVLIGNEIGTLYKNEYIDSARILGGSRLHLFCHHILPHLLPKLFVIFVQQIIQVMIIIGHLGFLGLLFGGTMKFQPGMALLSSTQEWAGLIGVNNNIQSISIYPWLVMGPIIMMTLGIIAFNFMLVGLQKALEANKVVKLKRGVRLEGTVNKDLRALEPFSFVTPRIDES
nr:ABC transporter permease subunit [Pullulanibacillus pueri]